jgi:hypothetical protein
MAFDCSNCRSHLGCKSGIWSLLTDLEPPRCSLVAMSNGVIPDADIAQRNSCSAAKHMHDSVPA